MEAPHTSAPARLSDRAAFVVLAFALALSVHGAWRVGPTFDEHFYVAAGYAYWQDGEFALNREHPPLAKLLCGLPLLALSDVEFSEHWREQLSYPTSFFYQQNARHLDRNLLLARLPLCLLTAAAGWAVYRWTSRRFSPRAGLTALALFALNPNVLAHGRLAALDMPVAALMFLAGIAFLALLERPTAERRLVAAVAFGLANLAKFTALVLVPFFLCLALLECLRRRSARPLGDLALTALGGLTVFAAGYGFEAKSVNAAWAEPQYVDDSPANRGPAVGPRELAEEAARQGLAAADAARVAAAPGLPRAVALLLEHAASDAPTAGAALRAVRALASAPGDERKQVFARVLALEVADPGLEEPRGDVLAALAGVRLGDRAAWRAWYERNQEDDWNRTIFTQPWIERLTRGVFGDARPIPLLSAWKGIDYQLHHGSAGHTTYFRGERLDPGSDFKDGNPRKEYYLWVMGIKNPLAWLALVGLGLVLACARWREWGVLAGCLFVGLPCGLFLVFSLGKALLGIRYVLPVLPFLCVLAGASAVRFPRLVPALALVAVLESLWIHPHELMYYNLAAGGPARGPEISVVGDDWGQDLRALGRFYAEHRAPIDAAGGLWHEPYTAGDPAAFGLDAAHLPVGPVRGIVAVNEVVYRREGARYAWLAGYAPFARIGWSIRLYDTREPPPGGAPLAGWEAAAR